MRSVLITGASGFVGEYIARRFRQTHRLHLASARNLPRAPGERVLRADLSVRDDFRRAAGDLPADVVVHTAAMVSPDACERDPDRARAVNVEGAEEVARWAEERGASLIFFSTDLVFDGKQGMYREGDPTGPTNVYGRMKLEAEGKVAEACRRAVILRLALSYGPTLGASGDWTAGMRRALAGGQDLTLYTDQHRTPAYLGDTAEAVLRLAEADATGIFHMGGGERLSRYDFGVTFARVFGLPPERFKPVRMADVHMGAPRAADCSMSTEKLTRETGLTPCDVETGLRRQLEEERALAV